MDVLRLIGMPVLGGGGKSVFPVGGAERSFGLVSTTAVGTGAQVGVYRRRAATTE